ncbi:hypothetical protein CMI42_06370 [Candidatus Pacearchaeota archaeon]|nr:hypothetical protein [Candidatus Pacearchaeota archaeon]|tara:strand:- start:116 stop:829 length:714 start_codon:yes stop_codon:yes gene_type:complete
MKNAIILCSGGLDSVVCANYIKKKLNYDRLIFLFFDYGQRTLSVERRFSKRCAKSLNGNFLEIKIDHFVGKESLINSSRDPKKIKRSNLRDSKKESEKYYVPNRNGIFINYAISLTEILSIKEKKIFDIFVGFNSEGSEAYPDATLEFVDKMNEVMKIMKLKGMVVAPLIKKDKNEIVRLGLDLEIDFRDTFSCYIDNKIHCGVCLACRLRQEAFYWANVVDPTSYKERMRDFRLAK